MEVVWRDIWAAGAAGELADGSTVRVVRQAVDPGEGHRPYWVVNLRPRYGAEVTLPERFGSLVAAKAAAQAWFDARPQPNAYRHRQRWRRVPNRPD